MLKPLMKGFLKQVKAVHRKIPSGVKRLYMPFIYTCSYRLQVMVSTVWPVVTLYKGQELNSKVPLTFAYAGFHGRVAGYWSESVLAPGFQKYNCGRHFFALIPARIRKSSPDCSFFLLEHTLTTVRAFPSRSGFRVPYWVSMDMDISGPMETLLGDQRQDMDRRIRKNKLSYTTSKDIKDFDDFFYNMFLPYIKDRHGDTANLDSYEILLKIFAMGEVLLLKKEDQIIAGALIEGGAPEGKLRRFGVRDGKWEYVRDGAITAMYYFVVLEMKKRQCRSIHIGATRPLLSNGITRYKVSIQARLEEYNKHSCLWMMFLKDTAGARNFLIHNPFIFVNANNQPARALFIEADEHTLARAYAGVLARHDCAGLKETVAFVFGMNSKDIAGQIPSGQGENSSIRSGEEFFKRLG